MSKYSQDDARAAVVTLVDYYAGLPASEEDRELAVLALNVLLMLIAAAERQARDERRALLN